MHSLSEQTKMDEMERLLTDGTPKNNQAEVVLGGKTQSIWAGDHLCVTMKSPHMIAKFADEETRRASR